MSMIIISICIGIFVYTNICDPHMDIICSDLFFKIKEKPQANQTWPLISLPDLPLAITQSPL